MTDPRITLTATDKTGAAFRSVIDRVDRVGKGLDGMRVAAVAAVGSLAAIGAAGAAAFAFTVRQADAIAKFQELSDKVGDSAVEIASLKTASDVSGVGLDTIAAASIRLTAALSKTDDESKGVGAALRALGVDLETFKGQRPVEQIDTLAQAFARFEDGAEKTAVAVALFGKAGAEVLPFMKYLAEQGGRQARLTEEQIEAADKFTKQLALLRSEVSLVAQDIGLKLIPAMSRLLENYRDLQELGGFDLILKDAARGLIGLETRMTGNVGADINRLLKERSELEAQMAADTRRTPGLQDDWKERIDGLNRYLELLRRRQVREALASAGDTGDFISRRFMRTDRLRYDGAPDKKPKNPKEDPVERYLENLQRQIQLTQDLTVEEKLLADIQAGRLGKVTEGQVAELRALAVQIDSAKAREQQVKDNRQAFLDQYDNSDLKRQQDEEEARVKRINALIEATPTAKLEEQRKTMAELADAYMRGELGLVGSAEAMAKYDEAANAFLGNVPPKVEELDTFLETFAENVQDSLGDGLYDLVTGNFDNIGDRFAQMVTRMITDAAAADLAKWLLGDLVKGGSGDGIFGSILKGFGSILLPGGGAAAASAGFGTGAAFGNLDFGGFFDKGTDFVPRDMLAVIHRGEAIVPAAQNRTGGRLGGATIALHQHFAPGTTRATTDQAAAAAARELQMATSRGTAGAR